MLSIRLVYSTGGGFLSITSSLAKSDALHDVRIGKRNCIGSNFSVLVVLHFCLWFSVNRSASSLVSFYYWSMERFNLCSPSERSKAKRKTSMKRRSVFFVRASREEMLQRAGTADNRGPRVPDGPAVTNPSASGSKGFTFTQLP